VSDFLQLLIAGATAGAIYGQIGLTFTLTYNATKLPNFAQGEFVMIGAMFAVLFFVHLKLPSAVAFALVITLGAMSGALFDRIIIEPMRREAAPIITQVMATLAAAIVIAGITAQIAGVRQLGMPAQFTGAVIQVGELTVLPQNLAVIGITALECVAVWAFMSRTKFGLSILATGYNPVAAQLIGINVRRVFLATTALSAGLAALAGAMIAPIISASPYMGLNMAIKGFIAAVIGGMGNPVSALIGGLIVGICETLISGYVSSSLNEVMTLGIMLIVLLVRPTGLVGERS
jgi:branched-chain amino acid transport system permease protein